MQPVQASFYNKTRAARKIIVVDLGFLGDSVHLAPALHEIKRNYPSASLHTLSAPVGAEVLRLVPVVDRAWDFPLGPPSPSWWEHWGILRALRQERFDLAFNFSGADRTLFIAALTGARWKVAYPGGRRHFWNGWLIPHWMSRQPRSIPVFEQRRQALAECGLELQTPQFGLCIPEKDRKWAANNLAEGAVHVSINASHFMKEWPIRHWIELCQALLLESPSLVIAATGSARAREQERLQQLTSGVANPRLRAMPAGLSVAQLASLLERCSLHMGADSGVVHLAMALSRPTISMFREYSGMEEWLPQGTQHRHLTVPCSCMGQKAPSCLASGEARCLADITPAQVLQECRRSLALLK